jgi:hypothetical protein
MESRRLVVWISAGILGFQGATLAFDLLNCTVLSWFFVRQHGLGVPAGQAPDGAAAAGREAAAPRSPAPGNQGPSADRSGTASTPPPPVVSLFDPTGHFCHQPHKRIDAAVGQGLTILAGLALGSSVGGGGRPRSGGEP